MTLMNRIRHHRLVIMSWLIFVIMCLNVTGAPADTQCIQSTSHNTIANEKVAVREQMSALYADINMSNLQEIVYRISTDYGYRIWYPLAKEPAPPLRDAWNYVEQKIRQDTGDRVSIEYWSEYSSLVGILDNPGMNQAPIVIGAPIASFYSPGANTFGAAVAAVLEIARMSSSLNLSNDIVFVFSNTVGTTFLPQTGDAGFKEVLNELITDGRRPAAVFWFSQLLYEYSGLNGDRIVIESDYSGAYSGIHLIADLAVWASNNCGTGRLMAGHSDASWSWEKSGAYEAQSIGIPSFLITEYYSDPFIRTNEDRWDQNSYSYEQLREAVGVVISLVWWLGSCGRGDMMNFEETCTIPAGASHDNIIPVSILADITIEVNQSVATRLEIRVKTFTGTILREINSSDFSITIIQSAAYIGRYIVTIENRDSHTTAVTLSFSVPQDFDNDRLDDLQEAAFGSDAIFPDTDLDYLTDYEEYLLNTDPRDPDQDRDGAIDGIEVALGASPFLEDTDGDGLGDGDEIFSYGTDPTDNDTDNDGLDDRYETEIGTSPLDKDTDGDGLSDSLEIQWGCSPLLRDTDNDTLSDLFEVINGLNPNNNDTDGDGLSDAYEIRHGLRADSVDSDGDGIPDMLDWMKTGHWLCDIPYIMLASVMVACIFWLYNKKRMYDRGA